MSQILGIKFSDHGPVCYFSSGGHELRTGQYVLVETDQGQALGRVATVKSPDSEASPDLPLAHLAVQPSPAPSPVPPSRTGRPIRGARPRAL